MNDNQTINVTAQLDSGESARQIRSALSDIQKQFAAVSASANSASASQESFMKKTQNTGKELMNALSATLTFSKAFPSFDGISTEYALFLQAA